MPGLASAGVRTCLHSRGPSDQPGRDRVASGSNRVPHETSLCGVERWRLDRTCIAVPDRPPETIAAATAWLSGLLREPSPNTLHSGSEICEAKALLGDPNHFAPNELGIFTSFDHQETFRVVMHVLSALPAPRCFLSASADEVGFRAAPASTRTDVIGLGRLPEAEEYAGTGKRRPQSYPLMRNGEHVGGAPPQIWLAIYPQSEYSCPMKSNIGNTVIETESFIRRRRYGPRLSLMI
jgi:hypothetical protein